VQTLWTAAGVDIEGHALQTEAQSACQSLDDGLLATPQTQECWQPLGRRQPGQGYRLGGGEVAAGQLDDRPLAPGRFDVDAECLCCAEADQQAAGAVRDVEFERLWR